MVISWKHIKELTGRLATLGNLVVTPTVTYNGNGNDGAVGPPNVLPKAFLWMSGYRSWYTELRRPVYCRN